MAVPTAVALVRQVQSIVESPGLLKANDCIDQVCSFLDCFLDHPDSRARLGAARALSRLSAGLNSEDRRCLQFHQAPKVLSRLQSEQKSGNVDDEDRELHSLLEALLSGDSNQTLAGGEGKGVRQNVGRTLQTAGEVLHLRVCVTMDEHARTAVRQALVKLNGVVSVTFEKDQIVVSARSAALLCDAAFIEDICTAAEEQLVTCLGYENRAVLVGPELQEGIKTLLLDEESTCSSPLYVDDDAEEADGIEHACVGASATDGQSLEDDGECEDEPLYLDDSDEEETTDIGQSASHASTSLSTRLATSWSFFSHTGFFSAQRLNEYEDDPTLVARLNRAHLRLERRRKEEQMRLSRVLSVITPLRAGASRRDGFVDEVPGVE